MNVCGNESMHVSDSPLIAHNSHFQQFSQEDQSTRNESERFFSFFDQQNFNNATIHSSEQETIFTEQNLMANQNQLSQNLTDFSTECGHFFENQTCNACSAILAADMPCLKLCHLWAINGVFSKSELEFIQSKNLPNVKENSCRQTNLFHTKMEV